MICFQQFSIICIVFPVTNLIISVYGVLRIAHHQDEADAQKSLLDSVRDELDQANERCAELDDIRHELADKDLQLEMRQVEVDSQVSSQDRTPKCKKCTDWRVWQRAYASRQCPDMVLGDQQYH